MKAAKFLVGILFLVSLGMVLYPFGVRAYNRLQERAEMGRFLQMSEDAQDKSFGGHIPGGKDAMDPFAELRAACEDYNESLRAEQVFNGHTQSKAALDPSEYGWQDEVFGILRMPTADIEQPIYLGATYANLLKGVAVMGGTSLPIGGSGSHSVIAGHRTWHGDDKLYRIDHLQIGDDVELVTLWGTLHYTVAEIQIIGLRDFDLLRIQPGRDLISVISCTPIGVNSHRYVVICERAS